MTFRVSMNHALQTYRASFDLAASIPRREAFDYETNDPKIRVRLRQSSATSSMPGQSANSTLYRASAAAA
jgi:hypothetical protein